MKYYICSRCNYKSNNKTKFIRHLERKKVCNVINENMSREKIYQKYFKKRVSDIFKKRPVKKSKPTE